MQARLRHSSHKRRFPQAKSHREALKLKQDSACMRHSNCKNPPKRLSSIPKKRQPAPMSLLSPESATQLALCNSGKGFKRRWTRALALSNLLGPKGRRYVGSRAQHRQEPLPGKGRKVFRTVNKNYYPELLTMQMNIGPAVPSVCSRRLSSEHKILIG